MVPAPLSVTGSLSSHTHEDLTTHIGTQFPSPNLQLSAILSSPNSETLIKDLANLISQRGVVFFKQQDLNPTQLKNLVQLLGEGAGKPKESGLHRHPISESTAELGDQLSIISSEKGIAVANLTKGERASRNWHSDISFEPFPSDYTILKMHTIPKVGGDTLWASGYEAYDRLSQPMRKFLEGLTAVHDGNFFLGYAKAQGQPILTPRGRPENYRTDDLRAVHPVIRTHPVTGFKSVYVNRQFTNRIVELPLDESDAILDFLYRQVSENHDLQVRYRWGENDVAIWDNRCTFHSATFDYNEKRVGDRAVSIGEKPYFDPENSTSRRDVLGIHDI